MNGLQYLHLDVNHTEDVFFDSKSHPPQRFIIFTFLHHFWIPFELFEFLSIYFAILPPLGSFSLFALFIWILSVFLALSVSSLLFSLRFFGLPSSAVTPGNHPSSQFPICLHRFVRFNLLAPPSSPLASFNLLHLFLSSPLFFIRFKRLRLLKNCIKITEDTY